MAESTVLLTVIAFLLTILFVLWRPKGINEAIPAMCGAILVILSGSVSLSDLRTITSTVSGAAITIMATIVMAIVLESFGFFNWAAELVAERARGSGIRLFWYVNLLCFLMTLLFNNDGSILITTPILLILLKQVGLKPHQQIPYLLSGALIATASSAPIGVSNIVNLIALKIVGMTLYMHTAMMFIPATLGLLVLISLLYAYFYRELPRQLPMISLWDHPLKPWATAQYAPTAASHVVQRNLADAKVRGDQRKFMRNIFLYVFAVRVSLFIASYFGIPVALAAVFGSGVLLGWRWLYFKVSPMDMLKKTPWHILVFAFGMYVVIFGLHRIGLTEWLVNSLEPLVSSNLLHASLIMGILVAVMSDLFNNHPALMIGTLTLTSMKLDPITLKISYLASVIGSDVGSLLLPIGTLATLIWMHILKQSKVKVEWRKYIRVTALVIPVTLLFTLVCLYYWIHLIF